MVHISLYSWFGCDLAVSLLNNAFCTGKQPGDLVKKEKKKKTIAFWIDFVWKIDLILSYQVGKTFILHFPLAHISVIS